MIIRTLLGRVAARPAVRAFASARVVRESNSGLPKNPEAPRDYVAEQVNRISEPADMSAVSGAPPALHQRAVRVFQQSQSAVTGGKAGTRDWIVDFDVLQGSGRWENQLIGWGSTADSQQSLVMRFDTKEDAIHFCEKQGWHYYVQMPHHARIPPKKYADNFVYSPGKLRIFHTK